MVCGQRRIVEAPILQVIEIPLGHRQMVGDLHPMPLGLEISVHRGNLKPWRTLILAQSGSNQAIAYRSSPID